MDRHNVVTSVFKDGVPHGYAGGRSTLNRLPFFDRTEATDLRARYVMALLAGGATVTEWNGEIKAELTDGTTEYVSIEVNR